MKTVIFGANGFIGSAVVNEFREHTNHEIIRVGSSDGSDNDSQTVNVDLGDPVAVAELLATNKPDIVINCAGAVVARDGSFDDNMVFSANILKGIVDKQLSVSRMIMCGSGSVYGVVEHEGAVAEDAPLRGDNPYALSKRREEELALAIAHDSAVRIVIARLFNPIGRGMKPRFLLPNLISQVGQVLRGESDSIELSRLDSLRDYLDVRDAARAIRLLGEAAHLNYEIYNIGSGKSTSNGTLLKAVANAADVNDDQYRVIETSPQPEANFASQADIARLVGDTHWRPEYSLEQSIYEIMNDD